MSSLLICLLGRVRVTHRGASVADTKITRSVQALLAYLLLHRHRVHQEKTTEDRGGYLLRYTKAPCVIAEPFFIDNDQDLAKAGENLDGLAALYARAIDEMAQMV